MGPCYDLGTKIHEPVIYVLGILWTNQTGWRFLFSSQCLEVITTRLSSKEIFIFHLEKELYASFKRVYLRSGVHMSDSFAYLALGSKWLTKSASWRNGLFLGFGPFTNPLQGPKGNLFHIDIVMGGLSWLGFRGRGFMGGNLIMFGNRKLRFGIFMDRNLTV